MLNDKQKNAQKLAVVLSRVGDIPTTNPFFFRHLTEIAPHNTVVISFTDSDSGLGALNSPALMLDRKRMHFRFKLSRMIWVWNLIFKKYHDAIPKRDAHRIAAFLTENRVKAVLAEDGQNGCAILPACLKAEIPLYTHFHGADVGVGGRRWECRASYRYLAKHAAGFIAPSYYLSEKLKELGFPESKIHVVHCGVNTDDFFPSEEKDGNLIIAIGRFIPKKAPNRTLEAFAEVLVDHPDAILEMIGTGPLLQKSIRQADELEITKNVIFNLKIRVINMSGNV